MRIARCKHCDGRLRAPQSGFALAEFLAAAGILLIVAASAFAVLGEIQRTAGFQAEIQLVLENTRLAMETTTRYIRQCGNDPLEIGFEGIEIIDHTSVRLRTDITGSRAPGAPDKGDPDGDTSDAAEDVFLRYNQAARTLEIATPPGGAQVVASNISAFSLDYLDAEGVATNTGSAVRRVRVNLSGKSSQRDPRTHQFFSLALASDVQIGARQ